MEDLICILHDNQYHNNCVIFDINDQLTKNITEYLKKTYNKTAKINSTYFISFLIALTLKEYAKEFYIAKSHLIAPCHYNWIENSLCTDVSREMDLIKLTPFKYIKNGFKIKNIEDYDSVMVKIFTDVDTDKEDFYIDDSDDNNDIHIVNKIYQNYYHYIDNVLDQYKSINNIELVRGGVIAERSDMKNIIKHTIYEFIKSLTLNLKKTVVRIEVGKNINSINFAYGDNPTFYFFDSNGKLYSKEHDYYKLNE